jgi:hypothetical protein
MTIWGISNSDPSDGPAMDPAQSGQFEQYFDYVSLVVGAEYVADGAFEPEDRLEVVAELGRGGLAVLDLLRLPVGVVFGDGSAQNPL